MRRRFLVKQFVGDRAVMEGEAAYHLGRVLRAQRGQFYELSDGHRVCLARIEEVKRGRINFSLVEDLPAPHPKLQTTLLLSVVKLNVFEFALEKATELGVNTIVPVAAARSEKALLVATPKRAERWKKILLESSQQSRRTAIPALRPLAKPEIAFSSQAEGLRILLSERPDAPSLHCILEGNSPARGYATATLAIGPEGGWIDAEFQCAQRYGFREASLGQLILRTETAVIAALASLNYALDRQQA